MFVASEDKQSIPQVLEKKVQATKNGNSTKAVPTANGTEN